MNSSSSELSESTKLADTSNSSFQSKLTIFSCCIHSSKQKHMALHPHSLSLEALSATVRVVSYVLSKCRKQNGKKPSRQLEQALCAYYLEHSSLTRGLIYPNLIVSTLRFRRGQKQKLNNVLEEY